VSKWTACLILVAGAALAACQGPAPEEAASPTPPETEVTPDVPPTQPAENETPPTPQEASGDPAACELAPRLLIGSWGVVAAEGAMLRSAPGTGDDSLPIETYPPGTSLTVLDGPVCLERVNWWQVYADEVSGWMAEGEAGTYWIDQLNIEPLPEPVEGWVGTVVKYPLGFHLDDYFEREDGERFGIAGMDAALQAQIEEYRWTGVQVEVWGQGFPGMADAGGYHIVAERVERVSARSGLARNLTPFATVSASSARPADEWNSYEAEAAIDGSLSTPWCEGVDGPGVGEWIRLTFPAPIVIDSIGIDPGYDRDADDTWRDPDLFAASNRVKSALVVFSTGAEVGMGFPDERGLVMGSLTPPTSEPPFVTTTVEIVIYDVHPGTSRDDTCLAEIEVWGRPD
jgi:hypothetical protein